MGSTPPSTPWSTRWRSIAPPAGAGRWSASRRIGWSTTTSRSTKGSCMRGSEMLFTRHPANPLLEPQQWPYSVNAVMNAGATLVDGTTVLLCRVEDRRGLSHLAVARSADGVSDWVVDDGPTLAPSPDHPEEEWGLEDPRITRV